MKERRIEKIREGYQIQLPNGKWRQVTYVSEGRAFYSLRRYYSLRLDDGSRLVRNKGEKLMSRNRKEVKKCGKTKS